MKKVVKRIIRIIALILSLLLVALIFLIFISTPKLPEGTSDLVENTIQSDLPELIHGESGFVISDDLRIWYEQISPKDSIKGSILLFMGISNDALGWPPAFLDALVAKGYQLIRFDYRSTGLSDWVDNYEEKPYSLSDISGDANKILEKLNIEKAHILGVSLGGMIAQDFAINYPNKTATLTSIMSTGDIMDQSLPSISYQTLFKMIMASIRYGIIQNEKNTIKLHLSTRTSLKGDAEYDIDVATLATTVLYNLRQRKGYNPKVSEQQQKATLKSGSRYEALKKLKAPILLIHGENDPLISIQHSKKLANILPDAKTMWVANMGHDIPEMHNEKVIQKIDEFYKDSGKNN